MTIIIIILLTLIFSFIIQDKYIIDKNKYKNKYINFYQGIKRPIFITCFVVIIYTLLISENEFTLPDIRMKEPAAFRDV